MICERVPPTRQGRRVRKWVPTLVEAAKVLEEAADQPAPAPADLGPTLKAFSEEFLRRHGPARNDQLTYGSNVRILLAHFGNEVRLGGMTVPMILDFRIARIENDKVAEYTTNRQVAALSAIFAAAKAWGVWSGENPCRRVRPFPEPDPRDRVFTGDEVERILTAAATDPMFRAMLVTAFFTGLRKGALRTLQWTDIRDGFVVVQRVNAKGKKRQIEVPIHPDLAAVFESIERKGPFVFHRDGAPFGNGDIRTAWARVCREAKIVNGRIHDIRRTFGTSALERGLSVGMIQRLYAHRQASTTEGYLHASRAAKKDAVPFLGPPNKKKEDGETKE